MNILSLLKTHQPWALPHTIKLFTDKCLNLRILTKLLIWLLHPVVLCKFQELILLDGNHSNCKVMVRLAMQEYLTDDGNSSVDGFNFFSRNVFTLLEFEDVLLSVDQSHCIAAREEHPNIPCFKPSVRGDGFFRFCLVFVVAFENWMPS